MEEENLFEYEGVSYPESSLREIYPEDFDKYVEQGVLTKVGGEEPVDVVETQEESLYEYEGVSYPESSLREAYPDTFDDYVEQGVLTKVDGLGKQIAVEDSAAARDMDLVSEDGSLGFAGEVEKPKYIVDGKEVNRAYLNDNLYKSEFVDKLQEGTIDVEVFNDPKLEELLKRQAESGSQWGDKIEAFNSGLSTLASGVVGAPGFIVDVFEEITGVEADIDAIDYLDELSEDLSKKSEELNNQQRAYKDDFIGSISEGNILDAVNIGFNTISNSAPIMIAAGLTGGAGGVAGALTSAATMSAIMIPAEYASTKISEDEKIKELSDGDKLTRAFFRGGAEGAFEGLMGPIGARSFSLFKDGVKNLIKTTAKESGTEAAKEVAEGMGKKTALEVFKTFGISTAAEGGSEALTALSQDLTDDYLGIQDLSVEEYMRNASEAAALGVFMGGVTTGALGGAGQVMSYLPLRNQKVYQGAKTEVREKQESGEINNEEAKQMDDTIESAKVALDKTDPSLSEENQEKVAKLIDERERIKLEIEGLDENQVPVQDKKNRIDEINKEISEIGIEKPSTEEETGVPPTPEEPASVETAPAEEQAEISQEEAQKADIERRRKEEIGSKESRSYTDDNGVTWTVEIQTLADKKVVRVRGEKNGEIVKDSPNTYSKELSNDKIYEVENADQYQYSEAIEVETKGKRTDKINAKYDAELAALEETAPLEIKVPEKFNNATVSVSKGESINEVELEDSINEAYDYLSEIENDNSEDAEIIRSLVEDEIEKLENYDNITETQTRKIAEEKTVRTVKKTPRKTIPKREKDFVGKKATYSDNKGAGGRGSIIIQEGPDGRDYYVIEQADDAKVILGRRDKAFSDGVVNFDENNNPVSVTFPMSEGKQVTVKDPAIAQEFELEQMKQPEYDEQIFEETYIEFVGEEKIEVPKPKETTKAAPKTESAPTETTKSTAKERVLSKFGKGRVQNKVRKQVENARKSLSKIAKGVTIEVYETQEDFKAATNGDSVSGGIYDPSTKTIKINLEKANPRTVAHEVFHALLLKDGITNARAQKVTSDMMAAVRKVASPKLLKELDDFASNYENELQSEESIAELFGILAENYESSPQSLKDLINEWLRKLAKILNVPVEGILNSDKQVLEFLDVVSGKVARGEVIEESDIGILQEQGSEGEVGTIQLPRQQINTIDSPKSQNDQRSWVRNLVEDIDIYDLNGRNFVTNMYDYTNAGLTELGNGYSINLLGGRNYVPIIMDKTGKKLGDVSNLAAFNTKSQAEGFIRNATEGKADLFAPHSGTLNGSWQFQQHIFESLVNLVLNENILSKQKLIDVFNSGLKSKEGKSALEKFNNKNKSKLRNLSSFKGDPKELVTLLDIENNYSPELRKILNQKIASDKTFQKAIGVKNITEFHNRMTDPLNKGVVGGEIMSFIEFDPTTFEVAKTNPKDVDHHPSFGWVVRAKIKRIMQPNKFFKSYDVTSTYTKYNTDKTVLSRKTEDNFAQSNVLSSAGAIPKVAKVSVPTTRQQQAQDDFTIQDVIKDAEQEGLTRKETIEVLQELGFTKEEIRSAIKPSPSVSKILKKPKGKKVSMSEKQALNKQIRDFARGVREAYKDQSNFKKKVNKLISDNFKLYGNLTPSKVIALTRRALEVDSSKPKSLDKFIDYAAKLEQMTEDNVRKGILKRVMRDIDPKKLKKRVGGILKGKISSYEGKVLSSIRRAIKEDNVESLQNSIDELENKQQQGIKLSEKEIFLLQVAKISNNLLSGDLKKTLEAEAEIEALIKDGKSKYREDIQKRAAEYERLVIESLPAITGGKKLTDQFGKLEQGAKGRPLTERIREKLRGFLDYGEGLRTLLDKIDRTAQRDESGYGGVIDKELYEPVADGRREKDSLDTSKINELSDKLDKLYGKKKKKALRDNQKPKNLGTFTDRKGNEVKLFLSQNQAYPLYQYMQDPSNMATFESMGFTDEMLQAVEDFLTPEVKEWADWQMSEFFPKYYDQINVVYKDMNDIDLPKQKIYVPIIRILEGFNEKEVGVDEITFGNPQSTYKSLNQRQSSKAPFDMTKDGNEKLMEYIEGMNRYIAFAKPVKRLNVVFKNKDVRNAIREFNSQETLKAIDGFIEGIANNSSNMGQRIALLDKIRGNVTIASLALAPTVTIKQLTSIPAYATDIPTSKFISGLGAFAKNPKKVHDILMESEYMQRRYKDGFERDLEGMKGDYDNMLKGTSNLKNKMMFLIKWGDKGAILMGGYSVYKYHFDKSRAEGKSIGESKKIALSKFEEATKLSQQSTNIEDLSHFQRMGSLGKLFTMYMTSPISYFRQERKSARDFVKGYKFKDKKLMRNAVKRFTIYHFVLPLVFQYVASGLPGLLTDWDEEDEKDLMRAASIGSLNGVFIAGQLISYFGDILTDKAWVRGGKFSPSPAFDAIVNIMNQSEDVIAEWNKNPNKFSDDLMKEMIDLGFSVDVAAGLPVNRVKKLIENWKTIEDDNDLETREKIALGLGFSPYVVTPKKKSTRTGGFKKSTREPKKSTRKPKK